MTANAAIAEGAFGRPLKWDMLTYGEAFDALDRLGDRLGYDLSKASSLSDKDKSDLACNIFFASLEGWQGLTSSEKEAAASLCVLLDRDVDYKEKSGGVDMTFRDLAGHFGVYAAELDALIVKGSGQAASAPAQAPTTSWKQDAKGWWVERADGSYLVSEWYQSPSSGLWYYMGSDGYMLTNTTTPDGYQVNADGVWVQ